MTPHLLAPSDVPEGRTPAARVARAYLQALTKAGLTKAVPNVATRMMALVSSDHILPVTINDGERGSSYVTQPHSAYVDYAREELVLTGLRWAGVFARPLITLADGVLRLAGINKVVMIDNWLLSTNLHGDWDGADLPAIRALLAAHFPGHALAIRSLDGWTCPALTAAVRTDGWMMLASRQIWVSDDPARSWATRRDVKADRRVLAASGLFVSDLPCPDDADAARIADLYRQLYVRKYSALNPEFTADWVRLSARSGLVSYRVARTAEGTIMAVAGMVEKEGVLTTPVVGYDRCRPQTEGLYRIACLMLGDRAIETGARINASAGAAAFKRNRGATGQIEYTGFSIAHLPLHRRTAFRIMQTVLDHVAIPLMRRLAL